MFVKSTLCERLPLLRFGVGRLLGLHVVEVVGQTALASVMDSLYAS